MLKLNKQQIKALAQQITSELNSEEIKEQKIKKWLNSEQSLEYKENVRPLFKKVKKILSSNPFIDYVYFNYKDSNLKVESKTEERDIFIKKNFSYNEDGWRLKETNVNSIDIEREVILSTIDSESITEIIDKVKKIYEY